MVAANLRAIGLTLSRRLHLNCALAMAYPIDTDVLLTVWVPPLASSEGVLYDPASYLRDLVAASLLFADPPRFDPWRAR